MSVQTILQNVEAAKQVNQSIQLSRKGEINNDPLVIPDLGFGEGSFIKDELAEMFFETIKDWRVKNAKSEMLILDVLQKWTRYFKNEIPTATRSIILNFKDHSVQWNHNEGELIISGGKTELHNDEILAIAEIFQIVRGMISKSAKYDSETKELICYNYTLVYRERESKSKVDHIENRGYKFEDAPDMDSLLVTGGLEELTNEELELIAASFYINEYDIDPWHRPDGTWFYELYYGPKSFEYIGKNSSLSSESNPPMK